MDTFFYVIGLMVSISAGIGLLVLFVEWCSNHMDRVDFRKKVCELVDGRDRTLERILQLEIRIKMLENPTSVTTTSYNCRSEPTPVMLEEHAPKRRRRSKKRRSSRK